MANFKEFICVLQKEDESLENQIYGDKEAELIHVVSMIDLSEIETYTEFINDAGEKENYVMAYMKSGNVFCIDTSYTDFKKLLQCY